MPQFARILILIALAVVPEMAVAHPGHAGMGFTMGLLHPLHGLDHVAMMLLVGLWSATVGGRSPWIWPAVFVVALTLGAALTSTLNPASWLVEGAVLTTLLLVGASAAMNVRASLFTGAAFLFFAGTAHGLALGIAAPGEDSARYLAGLVVATAGLLIVGIVLSTLTRQFTRKAGFALTSAGPTASFSGVYASGHQHDPR